MITVSTLGENVLRKYPEPRVRKKLSKGRPDLWTLGLLESNGKRVKK